MTPACSLSFSCARGTMASEASPTCSGSTENPLARREYSSWVGLPGSRDCRAALTSPRETSLQGGGVDHCHRDRISPTSDAAIVHLYIHDGACASPRPPGLNHTLQLIALSFSHYLNSETERLMKAFDHVALIL